MARVEGVSVKSRRVLSRIPWWLVAVLVLSACAANPHNLDTTFLDRYAEPNPTPASFLECRGFGCGLSSRVSLNDVAWRRVTAVFKPPVKDARSERQRIAQGIVLMQRLVGAQTGTAVHQWTHQNMIVVANNGDPTQLDCIDEAINTWTYMTMMERAGLFRFHRVTQLAHAGTLIEPRNTAVLQEIAGGAYFAIDPSIVDFGVLPPILPLAVWTGDWPPDLSVSETRR
jgi:hypothetical protein